MPFKEHFINSDSSITDLIMISRKNFEILNIKMKSDYGIPGIYISKYTCKKMNMFILYKERFFKRNI